MDQNTAIVPTSSEAFMPALSIREAIGRRNAIVQFVQQVMVPDKDYGVIPGTDKPTLLKPGAEKLNTLFGLSPKFILTQSVLDWTGDQHRGEPLFYFEYTAQLWRNERVMGEGVGSCNSREKKYRWRDSQRKCPTCGKPAIIKGKAEYGGGWLCFAKKGGCGAKFKEDDPAIIGQQVGQVINPDVADVVNTIQKMAQKRALIAATLLAVNASEFFTQDVEDMDIIDVPAIKVERKPEPTAPDKPQSPATIKPEPKVEPKVEPQTLSEVMAAAQSILNNPPKGKVPEGLESTVIAHWNAVNQAAQAHGIIAQPPAEKARLSEYLHDIVDIGTAVQAAIDEEAKKAVA